MKVTVSGSLTFDIEDAQPRIIFSVKTKDGILVKDITMLALPDDHKVTVSIQPVDAKGHPATIDGLAVWTSSNKDIADIANVSPDSLSAEVIPGTLLGTCQINVQADADLGSGITNITGVLDVQVVGGQAVGFTIQTGTPVPV